MKLAELQQEFFNALLGAENTLEHHVVTQGALNNAQRVSIYQNAYHARLKETIETDHEILGLYLGDDLFDEMVTGYIKNYPSQYYSLRLFAEKLPFFLQNTKPFNQHPIIGELARFERTLLHAFDAPESVRASLTQLQAIPPDSWPAMTFRLHPSVHIFKTDSNCVEAWQALKIQKAPPDAKKTDTYWIIWRNHNRLTEFSSLNNAELALLEFMLKGNDFSCICEALTTFMDAHEVSQFTVNTLVSWLGSGIISQLIHRSPTSLR